jgi:hypothetical protein
MFVKPIITLVATLFFGLGFAGEAPKKVEVQPAETAAPAAGAPAADKEISVAKAGAKCKAHGAAKEDCFICDPAKREKGRMWCKEHNRYEDRCFLCHPELKDSKRMWCKEHSLYEDECFLCHPELKKTEAKRKGK